MGTGIALVASMNAGLNVTLMDSNKDSVTKSIQFMGGLLDKYIAKQKMTVEQKSAILQRINITSNIADFAESQFVVEAASENTDLKLKIFEKLSEVTPKDAILASNTSSISITKIARATDRPEQVIGMHFMNPVPVMKLVEIIVGLQTSSETYDQTVRLALAMDKVTTKSQDAPGFIANRILMPYINEAIQTFSEGVANAQDIDTTMKLGTNVPMGPLQLADFIGLDTCLAIMQVLHTQFGDSKYRPSPLLIKMVDAGWLGKKSGRGFYTY